jgi:hypothetical protein
VTKAAHERDATEGIYKRLVPVSTPAALGTWSFLFQIPLEATDARISSAKGDLNDAIELEHWRDAISIEDRQEKMEFYREIPAWLLPSA